VTTLQINRSVHSTRTTPTTTFTNPPCQAGDQRHLPMAPYSDDGRAVNHLEDLAAAHGGVRAAAKTSIEHARTRGDYDFTPWVTFHRNQLGRVRCTEVRRGKKNPHRAAVDLELIPIGLAFCGCIFRETRGGSSLIFPRHPDVDAGGKRVWRDLFGFANTPQPDFSGAPPLVLIVCDDDTWMNCVLFQRAAIGAIRMFERCELEAARLRAIQALRVPVPVSAW
jgi:hypothetical protein